jgi:hypothetical protein
VNIYLNAILSGSANQNSGTPASGTTNVYLGCTNLTNRIFDGAIVAPNVYSEIKSTDWITAEYQKGLKALCKTDWGVHESVAAVTSGYLENSPFQVGSGSFKISKDTISGDNVKVIECVSSGYVYLLKDFLHQASTEAAYGTWEWYMNKATDGNSTYLNFIASTLGPENAAGQNGYGILFSVGEAYILRKSVSGTPSNLVYELNAITYNQWHKVKVTRTNNNSFTLYLDDDLISADLGTNPIVDSATTTSSYIIIDLDAGDKVAYSDPYGQYAITKKIISE